MKNYKLLFLFGIILLIIPFIIDLSIFNLKEANFISISSNAKSFKPCEQIQVTFTYKNTWYSSTNFRIKCILNGEEKSIIRFIAKGETITESFILNAPANSGVYVISLSSDIQYSNNKYISDGGKVSIPIAIQKVNSEIYDYNSLNNSFTIPINNNSNINNNPKLIVKSNVANVEISYDYESKTIGSSKTIEFSNIPVDKNFEFIATKNEYIPYKFNVTLTNQDKIVNIDMQEIDPNFIIGDEYKLLIVTINNTSIPIQNCRVFIDNTTTKFTNLNGEVSFNVIEGNHLVVITNDDYLTIKQNYDINQNSKITVRMTDKSKFTNTSTLNTDINDVNYLIYLMITGGILITFVLLIFSRKNKK